MMKVSSTEITDVKILQPSVIVDERGHFMESWRDDKFREEVADVEFVQDNISLSSRGVLRGLHYQLPPFAQGKLVRVLKGAIYDVVVDLRKSSNTFGLWLGVELSEANNKQLWVPAGCAHGFLSLMENTEVMYKVTDYYAPDHEAAIVWNDDELGIAWPKIDGVKLVLSQKDALAPKFREAVLF